MWGIGSVFGSVLKLSIVFGCCEKKRVQLHPSVYVFSFSAIWLPQTYVCLFVCLFVRRKLIHLHPTVSPRQKSTLKSQMWSVLHSLALKY